MISDLSKPLTDRDIGELDEILAAIPETHDPLDVALLDGFLAGVLLQPDLVLPSAWLPLVFDAQGGNAALPDLPTASRATELVMRRYNELAACIAAREPFDPIVFELENERGEVLTGREGIAALAAWAGGFANAFDVFPSLRTAAAGDDELAGLLTGILRHLPEDPDATAEEREAYASDRVEIERAMPLRDLDDAIDDLVQCVLDIADLVRPNRPLVRDAPKVGRNEPCPCGSGRKYKACHGRDSS